MKLTEKQKQSYMKRPFLCPFCKSTNISAGRIDVSGRQAW
jgi:transcription elongation factor Elf1